MSHLVSNLLSSHKSIGVLSILFFTSIYFLGVSEKTFDFGLYANTSIDSHRGFPQTNFRTLLLSIMLLYLSTGTYMAAFI